MPAGAFKTRWRILSTYLLSPSSAIKSKKRKLIGVLSGFELPLLPHGTPPSLHLSRDGVFNDWGRGGDTWGPRLVKCFYPGVVRALGAATALPCPTLLRWGHGEFSVAERYDPGGVIPSNASGGVGLAGSFPGAGACRGGPHGADLRRSRARQLERGARLWASAASPLKWSRQAWIAWFWGSVTSQTDTVPVLTKLSLKYEAQTANAESAPGRCDI